MKKFLVICMCLLAATFVIETTNVSATFTGFEIATNSNWGKESTENTKPDSNLLAYVKWTGSDKDSHKEWFQIVNSNNEVRSEARCFSYQTNGYINEINTVKGYYYYLRARREYIVDPKTTVTGTWES